MHIAGQRRVGEVLACGQEIVGVLLEKERRLAARVMAHLDRMVGVVTPDAVNAAYRERLGCAFDGKQDGMRKRDDGGGKGHCTLLLFVSPDILDGKQRRGNAWFDNAASSSPCI